jgi:hypothetical protein
VTIQADGKRGNSCGEVLAEPGATTQWQQGRFVSVPMAVAANAQGVVPADSTPVFPPFVDALLADLPGAHRALPIGRRVAGQGCHGAVPSSAATGVKAPIRRAPALRVRFVYFPSADDSEYRMACHQHLVRAEVLLDRVLAACAAGRRPMVPALDQDAEARALVRPPRAMFLPATLEYRRWYRADGTARAQPLTQEALSLRLAATDDLSMKEARARVARRSHALPGADQAWLIDRRNAPLQQRPLNRAEFLALVDALDGIWRTSVGTSHVECANRRIALRVVALLGNLLDDYVAPPFQSATLSQAFNEHHLAHLRQTIEHSRQAESASRVLLAGPQAWFAAKTVRMRAEHQLGLATSPASSCMMRLAGRPMIAVVGGRLHTFVDGRRPVARAVMATPGCATFG